MNNLKITVEGLSHTGKSTIMSVIAKALSDENIEVTVESLDEGGLPDELNTVLGLESLIYEGINITLVEKHISTPLR